MNREFLESNIVNVNSDKFENTFLNNWQYILIDPDFFFGEGHSDIGIDFLRSLEDVSDDYLLSFFLTTFSDVDEIEADWNELYSTSEVNASDKIAWQLAFAGMYFTSHSLKWCGVYLDTMGQECIVFGANDIFIEKLKSNIPESVILDAEYILDIQRRRAYNKAINRN